ncbi:MAG: hypothetical protein ACRCW9_09810 [Cetobacterium sp.]
MLLKKLYHYYLYKDLKREYLHELELIDLYFIGSEKLKLKYYKFAKLEFKRKLKEKNIYYLYKGRCKNG